MKPRCSEPWRRRLEAVGIECDEAASYEEAKRFLNANEYAVLVTELHLPDRHPYHLVMDLLQRPTRPLIVVATDIREPRMAEHLYDEGVEEVLFKPVDYTLMSAKLKVLANRWQRQWSPAFHARTASPQEASLTDGQTVAMSELRTKLQHLTGMLPLSATAFDVFNATREERFDAKQIEQVIAKEASLAVELLRLANSNAYNASTERITSLEQAVVRVGRRKIGELALAHTAKTALTQRAVPWLNIDLLWRRSLAASAAAELLEKDCKPHHSESLVLPALMHGLGRVVLASLYPQIYDGLLSQCEESREAAEVLEQRVFPLTPGGVMACVLELWGLPAAVWKPLSDENDIELRQAKQLLQSALTIGNLTTANWQDFDRIDVPSGNGLIDSERFELTLRAVTKKQSEFDRSSTQPSRTSGLRIRYARLATKAFDLPGLLLNEFSDVESVAVESLDEPERVVIDCRDVAPYSSAPFVSERSFDPRRVIIANRSDASEFRRFGNVVSFPMSYAAFHHVCVGASSDEKVEPRVVHTTPFQPPIANSFDTKL